VNYPVSEIDRELSPVGARLPARQDSASRERENTSETSGSRLSVKFGPAVEWRILCAVDLPALADLHVRAFPHAAVSRLGRQAARRYYASVFDGPHQAVGIGAFDQGRLVGYCFGGVWLDPEKHFLKKNLRFVAQRVLMRPSLLGEPFFRERIRNGLRLLLPRRSPRPAAAATGARIPPVRSFGILYLAVDPRERGRGLARSLMELIEGIARQKGFQQMDLSVYLDNHAAIKLYEGMQWQKVPGDEGWQGFMLKRLE